MTDKNKPLELEKVYLDVEDEFLVIRKVVWSNNYRFGIPKAAFSDAEYGAIMKTFDQHGRGNNNIKLFDYKNDEVMAVNDVRVPLRHDIRSNLRLQIEHILNDPRVTCTLPPRARGHS